MVGCTILQAPRTGRAGRVLKGAALLTNGDTLCRQIPDLRRFFYVIERHAWAWTGQSRQVDIKLVTDPSAWRITRRHWPDTAAIELGAADFVSTEAFAPLGIPKPYAAVQIARWDSFKRHELFVDAAARLPDLRFLKFGHFASGTRRERALRDAILARASRRAPNVEILFGSADSNADLPFEPERINHLINQCAMGVVTSRNEGMNRFRFECMAAGIPTLVASDAGEPLRKHLTHETGLFFEPTPPALAAAIRRVLERGDEFRPRKYMLRETGSAIASRKLREALRELAKRDGEPQSFDEVAWDARDHVWGPAAAGVLRAAIAKIGAPPVSVRSDRGVVSRLAEHARFRSSLSRDELILWLAGSGVHAPHWSRSSALPRRAQLQIGALALWLMNRPVASLRQVLAVAVAIAEYPQCRMLIFELGSRSFPWNAVNHDGRTVFLGGRTEHLAPRTESYPWPDGSGLDVGAEAEGGWPPLIPPPLRAKAWDLILLSGARTGRGDSPAPSLSRCLREAGRLARPGGMVFVHGTDAGVGPVEVERDLDSAPAGEIGGRAPLRKYVRSSHPG
jgi:hypothetical protein